MELRFDEQIVRAALKTAWSRETARQWTEDMPVAGQCNVTTVVIHDLYGGRILKTPLPGVDHFYNEIDGNRIDLTDSQFEAPIQYEDILTTREETMLCLKPGEYDTLRKNFLSNIGV